MMTANFQCPACRLQTLQHSPRDKWGLPSYEVCPSCGFEPGVTDDDAGYTCQAWHDKWLAAGKKWPDAE